LPRLFRIVFGAAFVPMIVALAIATVSCEEAWAAGAKAKTPTQRDWGLVLVIGGALALGVGVAAWVIVRASRPSEGHLSRGRSRSGTAGGLAAADRPATSEALAGARLPAPPDAFATAIKAGRTTASVPPPLPVDAFSSDPLPPLPKLDPTSPGAAPYPEVVPAEKTPLPRPERYRTARWSRPPAPVGPSMLPRLAGLVGVVLFMAAIRYGIYLFTRSQLTGPGVVFPQVARPEFQMPNFQPIQPPPPINIQVPPPRLPPIPAGIPGRR
jgi:hypothetical protein